MSGSNKGTPLLSVLGQLLNVPPCAMKGLELPFHSSTPGVLGSPFLPLLLWCPVESFTRDVVRLSSHHVSDPSPSPLFNDGVHAVLVATGEKMLIGDGLGPEQA